MALLSPCSGPGRFLPRPTVVFVCPPCAVYAHQASEVEETLKRIRSHRGVEGILIVNNDGVSLKSTLSAELTTQYASLFAQVSGLCAGVGLLVQSCVGAPYCLLFLWWFGCVVLESGNDPAWVPGLLVARCSRMNHVPSVVLLQTFHCRACAALFLCVVS
jgi:hypothetical protein